MNTSSAPLPLPERASFGDVRALLQRPGPMSWRLLGALVNGWPDARERDEVIAPYCADSLRAWPDHLRAAPPEWIAQALDAAAPPALALCSAITVDDPTRQIKSLDPLLDLDLPALRRLELRSVSLNQSKLRALLHAPLSGQLTHLSLYDQRLNEPLWDMLLGWERLPMLAHLGLERCRITPAHDVRDAARAGGLVRLSSLLDLKLPALTSLNLRDNTLRDADMEAIASAPALAALSTLLLGACPVEPGHADRHTYYNRAGEPGLRALMRGPSLAGLEGLELSYHQLNDETSRPLWQEPPRALKRLDLHLNHIKSASGKALAASALMAQLDALDLSGDAIGARAIGPILAASPQGQLVELRISRVKLGRAGVAALVGAHNLTGLRRLEIADNELTSADLAQLLAALPTRSLTHLNIGRNVAPLDDAAIDAILASPACQTLRQLQLGACADDALAYRLVEDPDRLPHIERVSYTPSSYKANNTPLTVSGPRAWLLDKRPVYQNSHLLLLTERMLEP